MPSDTGSPAESDNGNDAPVQRLLEGVREFQDKVYPEHRQRFERLAKGQSPNILFITCADSRVVPEMITQTDPGELFVCRNIGNIVPGYGEMLGGVSAVIEYAVVALGVSDIVVCGHSDCGAMKGLLSDASAFERMPTVWSWLRNATAARSIVEATKPDLAGEAKLQAVIAENVLTQIRHLGTHPAVAAGMARGQLKLHGWVYDIETGDVVQQDVATGQLERIGDAHARLHR